MIGRKQLDAALRAGKSTVRDSDDSFARAQGIDHDELGEFAQVLSEELLSSMLMVHGASAGDEVVVPSWLPAVIAAGVSCGVELGVYAQRERALEAERAG